MSLPWLPSSFSWIQLKVWEEMSFEEFQDGHLGYQNGTILAILNLYVASHQVSAQSDLLFGRRCHLKNGGHLVYRNIMFLAILNLYVTVMPPIMFWLNPTYGLGWDVIWRISRWPPWWPSWILELKDFSKFESPIATMPLTKFQLNPTYGSGGECRKCEKLTMDGGWTTDNRPWHKLT